MYRSLVVACLLSAILPAAEPTAEQLEFFEKKIRPVLAGKCYGCHNSKVQTPLGGLRVDTRDGLMRGGDSGPAIVPGDPAGSRLVHAVSYKEDLKMPPAGKLSDEQIADIAAWVKMGAPDPRTSDAPPVRSQKKPYDFNEGRRFWAFQPIKPAAVPTVRRKGWVRSPIDAFLLAKLEGSNLAPAKPADKRTLIRRVYFDLIGLPPTPGEVSAFLADTSPLAFQKVVDRLLASPHYGERWARHWLDLVRYAETNGHEYDNDKLDPWRYRDYVIRAFNEDVPYDQFAREHVAGDLLPSKRLREDGDTVESPLGTTALWFGEVLNSATDSEKSRADDVDNQIDVLSKTFLGMTVACARCHDHKFDPIPTADYYAMAGILHSTELREAAIDSPARAAKIRDLSEKIRTVNARIEALQPPSKTAATPIEYRTEDKPFERFENGFGKWVTQSAAFGDKPIAGFADSRSAGSNVFMGTLTSPKFRTGKELFLHVRMGGTPSEPKLKERGPIRFTIVADGYKGQHIVPEKDGRMQWRTLRLTFERERTCYFEIVDRSREGHIVVDEIVFSSSEKPPAGDSPAETHVQTEVPPSGVDQQLAELRAEKARLEAQVPPSEFAMIAEDHEPRDIRLHIRGNHKNPGEVVPRRFLQVVAGEQQDAIRTGSGRLEFAELLTGSRNPLLARVMANRIWKHHFGYGLVRSTDNFGKMGETPSHPELLDFLASEFVRSGWSVKAMHRLMVLSSAYGMSSEPSADAKTVDPQNKLLQHMPVRRLEAEAVRDAVLSVAGTLDRRLFGPSVVPYITPYQDGRGKPDSGPLEGNGRRSIYIQVRRNFMTPLFLAFDYPTPISTIGVRTVSTVPSQALMMMNNELIAQQAGKWAQRVIDGSSQPETRVQQMYLEAFARPPEPAEIAEIASFVSTQGARPESEVWGDVAHVLLNSPEFIYVQ